MKALFQLLEEYLASDYSPEEILEDIRKAKITNVRSDSFTVTWHTGVKEFLELNENGKLIRISDPNLTGIY